jgi:hypothetical protein
MKKTMIFAATALASTIAIASPAAAQSLSPEARMETTCNNAKPTNSSNHTYAAIVIGGTPVFQNDVETSRTTIENIPGGTKVGQTPFLFLANSEGRNGGSPNIHGIFVSTVTYSGGKLVQRVVTEDIATYTYGCRIERTNKNTGRVDLPPEAQVAPTLTFSVRSDRREFEDTVEGDNYTETEEQERVICNSPGSRGGQWRAQNGYTGACTTAAYLALSNQVMPRSNSVPSLFVSGKPDHTLTVPADSDFVAQLIDTSADLDTGE